MLILNSDCKQLSKPKGTIILTDKTRSAMPQFGAGIVEAARASICTLRKMNRRLDRLDLNQLKAAQDSQDALAEPWLVQDLILVEGD